jgi:hypothetical protein
VSRQTTSFVLGYHGCDQDLAREVVLGNLLLEPSKKDYDWLGPGIYFWESDPKRALEWAQEKAKRGKCRSPCVLGAVIDLRNCLDLSNRDDISLIQSAFKSYEALQQISEADMPANKSLNVRGQIDNDRKLRFLDCAVITHLHKMMEEVSGPENSISFDTVRGTFTEGPTPYPGCGFTELTHTQIAVRNVDCIKGFFLPPIK